VTRPGRDDPAVSVGDVRAVRFCGGDYRASEIDDLLGRVAAELDAGRPVGSLIRNARFRRGEGDPRKGYNVDAVDWFLDQLLLSPGYQALAGADEDPWRDLGEVTQLARGGISAPARDARGRAWLASEERFAEECADAWRDFGQAPGTHLWWGRVQGGSRELRTPEAEAIVSLQGWRYGGFRTASTGGRTFTFKKIWRARSSPQSLAAEIVARSERDLEGHYATNKYRRLRWNGPGVGLGLWTKHVVWELVDETGTPILYTSGGPCDWRAWAGITFPDGRWLRFLVRGTEERKAIMTAVDQAGNKVARYRITYNGWSLSEEIIVHPDWKLTDELALAIAISAPWLSHYFASTSG
jgi:DivIVA domain-containing protein